MQQSFAAAVDQQSLKPAGMPEINDVVMELDKDLSFSALIEIFNGHASTSGPVLFAKFWGCASESSPEAVHMVAPEPGIQPLRIWWPQGTRAARQRWNRQG